MNPLTICMFSNLFPPVVSGSSTQVAGLSHQLARLGHQVIVITAQTAENMHEYENIEGVHVYRLPALRLPRLNIAFNFPWLSYTFTPGNLRRISKIIDKHRPDVLHLHNHMFDLALSAVVMRWWKKLPLVLTIHTLIKHPNFLYNMVLFPADRIFLRFAVVRKAQEVISPDANAQRYVEEAFHRFDSMIVPYGIELKKAVSVQRDVDEIRQKYGLEGKRVILSLGHVHDIRNRKDLIDAMPHILKSEPATVLLIVGSVSTQEPIERVARLGLEKSVLFTDYVPHSLVPAFLQLADLEAHWLNQDSPETTSPGIATLEALSAGKVVLAAVNPNSYGKGVLLDTENIMIVKPGRPEGLAETIVDLLRDDVRREIIGQMAAKTIPGHFSWESVCAKTVMVYRQAMGQ